MIEPEPSNGGLGHARRAPETTRSLDVSTRSTQDGTSIALPPSVFYVLERAAEVMARGDSITIVPVGRELTCSTFRAGTSSDCSTQAASRSARQEPTAAYASRTYSCSARPPTRTAERGVTHHRGVRRVRRRDTVSAGRSPRTVHPRQAVAVGAKAVARMPEIASTSRRPSATSMTSRKAASSSSVTDLPFRSRNTTAASHPSRLLPSTSA